MRLTQPILTAWLSPGPGCQSQLLDPLGCTLGLCPQGPSSFCFSFSTVYGEGSMWLPVTQELDERDSLDHLVSLRGCLAPLKVTDAGVI